MKTEESQQFNVRGIIVRLSEHSKTRHQMRYIVGTSFKIVIQECVSVRWARIELRTKQPQEEGANYI